MKANYTISSAKTKLIQCGMRFEGKRILGAQPGIKGWGAIDFLKTRGYKADPDIPKIVKEKITGPSGRFL